MMNMQLLKEKLGPSIITISFSFFFIKNKKYFFLCSTKWTLTDTTVIWWSVGSQHFQTKILIFNSGIKIRLKKEKEKKGKKDNSPNQSLILVLSLTAAIILIRTPPAPPSVLSPPPCPPPLCLWAPFVLSPSHSLCSSRRLPRAVPAASLLVSVAT